MMSSSAPTMRSKSASAPLLLLHGRTNAGMSTREGCQPRTLGQIRSFMQLRMLTTMVSLPALSLSAECMRPDCETEHESERWCKLSRPKEFKVWCSRPLPTTVDDLLHFIWNTLRILALISCR